MKNSTNNKTSYLNNKGATMIAAIIIMAILIVFTFSLTLIAYTLYASQNKNVASLRCSEAANTLSKALEDEITYVNDEEGKCPEKDSYLYRYLRYNLCQDNTTWPYYNGNNKQEAFRYFDLRYKDSKKETVTPAGGGTPTEKTVDGVEGLPGRSTVCIYWKLPEDSGVSNDQTAQDHLLDKNGIILCIEITCEAANQSYTVTKEYVLQTSSYPASESDKKEYLKDALTKYGYEFTNPCTFNETETNISEKWEWKRLYDD